MNDAQREFIDFLVRSEVLTFGDFVTKSGRRTPFFLNTGRFRTGEQIHHLARAYARTLVERLGREFDVLFGPAYKGIPLVTATSMILHQEYDLPVSFCFNRKEVKDHGEGGSLVGHVPRDGDRVVLVEDVTTAGTSIRETVPLLTAVADVDLAGLVVAVDRQERGQGEKSALSELEETFAMPAFAIVRLDDVVEHLSEHAVDGRRILTDELLGRIQAYREEFGAA